MIALHFPTRNDPISKILLSLMLGGALWLNAWQFQPEATAQSDPGYTIIAATATPSLPTPALGELPAGLAVATPIPHVGGQPVGWLDQALAVVDNAGDQFSADQAAHLAAEQAQYLANVGAQATHSPRGDAHSPPPSQTGPILIPATGGEPAYIVAPQGSTDPVVVADPGIAVAVPELSADQAAVLGQRTSNGCANGQVFYPRSGCHTPGSGGPQPGAVGQP